jgi:hypothetical protein
LDTLLDNVILPWLTAASEHDELIEDELNIIYSLLNKFLLHSGYQTVYNELGAKILAKINDIPGLNSFFTDEFRVYLLVNMAANAS